MYHSLSFKLCALSFCFSQGMVAAAFFSVRRWDVACFLLSGSLCGATAVLRGYPMARSLKKLEELG